jgi:hypothetical protein
MPFTTIQALKNGPYKVQGPIRAIDAQRPRSAQAKFA